MRLEARLFSFLLALLLVFQTLLLGQNQDLTTPLIDEVDTVNEAQEVQIVEPVQEAPAIVSKPVPVQTSIKNLPISPLTDPPDWRILSAFDYQFTQAQLRERLKIICANNEWKRWFIFHNNELHVVTETGPNYATAVLKLKEQHTPSIIGGRRYPYRYWRTTQEIKSLDYNGNVLPPVRVALDPGHLGGRWAEMEFRNFAKPGDANVAEGDLVLMVANKVRHKLEALGAQVYMVRESDEPATPIRPEHLATEVKEYYPKFNIRLDARLQKLYQEQWFYQVAEIRERAELINDIIKPDVTICLHLNAVEWGSDPKNPVLRNQTHAHILLSGAATKSEMAKPDQRLDLLLRALQGIYKEEQKLGTALAKSLEQTTNLKAFTYKSAGKNTLKVAGHPYLWARNLLANRIYTCPVIYYEPYVMNSVTDYPRFQHAIENTYNPDVYTILDEYADAVVDGFIAHYAKSEHLLIPPSIQENVELEDFANEFQPPSL